MDNNPQLPAKVVKKWLKDNKANVLVWPSQSPVGKSEKVCVSEAAYKPDPAPLVLSGGIVQNSSKLL